MASRKVGHRIPLRVVGKPDGKGAVQGHPARLQSSGNLYLLIAATIGICLGFGYWTGFERGKTVAADTAIAGLECWSLASETLRQEGWKESHWADKFTGRIGDVRIETSLACFEVDQDGLPGKRHMVGQWWRKPR